MQRRAAVIGGGITGLAASSASSRRAAALLLKLGQEGNVRTHGMRLFDGQEFAAMVAGM
jgi:hypothetical protein